MTAPPEHQARDAFLQTLPRKVTELRATLGAVVADPRSQRIRDELRRRLEALHTLVQQHPLPTLDDGLRKAIARLDALGGLPTLASADLDALGEDIAGLLALGQRDVPDRPELFRRARPPTLERRADATAMAPTPHEPRPAEPKPRSIAPAPPPPSAGTNRGPFLPPPARVPTMPLELGPRSPAPVRAPTLPPKSTGASVPPPPATTRGPSTSFGPPRSAPLSVPPPQPRTSTLMSMPAASLEHMPVGVLVVGSDALGAELRRALPADAELTVVRTLTEAVPAARDSAPDVLVAELAPPADGLGLLAALRGDPLTDFLPVVLVAASGSRPDEGTLKAQGAFEVLTQPVERERWRRVLERASFSLLTPSLPSTPLGEVSLEELTKILQEELRRGLVGSVGPRNAGVRVPLGQGSEILAATWEAIARVRELIEKRTRGRVRFEMPAAPVGLGSAHVVAMGAGDEMPAEELTGEDPLKGRSALVVDDDPSVVWFFSGLLREAGMSVTECTDSVAALREARTTRPDVLIADILMPELDGFGLCRAIRRDVGLRHTPVILLSWKDDLLVRMRELGAQAQGFLKKEARREAILQRVRAVLRPRARLLRRVETLSDGELRGRVERVGLFTLLHCMAEKLRDASLSVTDSFSVTELELRGGALVSAVRTAQDGSFSRGEGALMQLLGGPNARFVLKRASGPVRANLQGPVKTLLDRLATRIAAVEDAVSGAQLAQVEALELDTDAAQLLARTLPGTMRPLAERLARGESPRAMLAAGIALLDLETVLVELARRGLLRGVKGVGDRDLVAERMEVLSAPDARLVPPRADSGWMPAVLAPSDTPPVPTAPEPAPVAPPPAPAAPASAESSAPPASDETNAALRQILAISDAEHSTPPAVSVPVAPPVVLPPAAPLLAVPPPPPEAPKAAPPRVPPPPPPSADPEPEVVEEVSAESEVVEEVLAEPYVSAPPEPPAPPASAEPAEREATPAPAPAQETEPPKRSIPPAAESPADTSGSSRLDARGLPRSVPPPEPEPLPEVVVEEGSRPRRNSVIGTSSASILVDTEAVGAPVEVHEPEKSLKRTELESERPPAPPRNPGPSPAWLLLGVLGLGGASYFGMRAYLDRSQPLPTVYGASTEDAGVEPPADAHAAPSEAAVAQSLEEAGSPGAPDADTAGDAIVEVPAEAGAAERTDVFDEDPAPYLDGGALPNGQGLLVVQGTGAISLNRRPAGDAPLRLVLRAGEQTVSFRRGEGVGLRYVTVSAGRATRLVLPAP